MLQCFFIFLFFLWLIVLCFLALQAWIGNAGSLAHRMGSVFYLLIFIQFSMMHCQLFGNHFSHFTYLTRWVVWYSISHQQSIIVLVLKLDLHMLLNCIQLKRQCSALNSSICYNTQLWIWSQLPGRCWMMSMFLIPHKQNTGIKISCCAASRKIKRQCHLTPCAWAAYSQLAKPKTQTTNAAMLHISQGQFLITPSGYKLIPAMMTLDSITQAY